MKQTLIVFTSNDVGVIDLDCRTVCKKIKAGEIDHLYGNEWVYWVMGFSYINLMYDWKVIAKINKKWKNVHIDYFNIIKNNKND